jgi:hypothetical protein
MRTPRSTQYSNGCRALACGECEARFEQAFRTPNDVECFSQP